ncbi:hypothetical protein [Marivita sp. S2033]|uniref:hypothetical protein n=1 Tax=Marivita sp. S2033 TaxID=3373187 RepID=UPI0039822CF0
MYLNKTLSGLMLGAALFLTACAEQAHRVPAAYIPSIIYRGATCQELYQERVKLAGYVRHITAEQRNAAQGDVVFFTAGALIFWPALLALPISVDQSAQLSVARGHYDSLSKAMVEQGCIVGAGGHRAAPQVVRVPSSKVSVGTYQQHPDAMLPNWKRYPGQFPPM